jgi:hypothetical protein
LVSKGDFPKFSQLLGVQEAGDKKEKRKQTYKTIYNQTAT